MKNWFTPSQQYFRISKCYSMDYLQYMIGLVKTYVEREGRAYGRRRRRCRRTRRRGSLGLGHRQRRWCALYPGICQLNIEIYCITTVNSNPTQPTLGWTTYSFNISFTWTFLRGGHINNPNLRNIFFTFRLPCRFLFKISLLKILF